MDYQKLQFYIINNILTLKLKKNAVISYQIVSHQEDKD